MSLRRVFQPIGRRTFVKTAGAAAAAAWSGCGASDTLPTERVPNLIIGSGFGGSIAALRLALAGHPSLVLERGRRWTVTAPGEDVFADMGFTRDASFDDRYDFRAAWFSERQPLPGVPPLLPLRKYAGILERVPGMGIDIVCAAGVGGGSLVYSGMMVRPPDDLFRDVFPQELTPEVMTPYYERVRDMMQPAPIPEALLERPEWTASRTFLEQATRANIRVERLLCAFDWERAMLELTGAVPPQLIRGHYIFGLNSGAKRSLDRTYLTMAEATSLCEVRPLHWVQRIAETASGWRAEVDVIDEDGVVLERRAFVADRLFVCAGTANTTGLLQRARSERTIADLPENLGEGFGNNGQHIMARTGVGVDTGEFQAGPACLMMFDESLPVAMENGPAPIGAEMQLLIGTGQGVPSGRGQIGWDAATAKVLPRWDASYDAEAKAHAEALVARLNAANGGVDATRSLGLTESVTFHPLGGCVMGEVTDLAGRVRGKSGLYVLDGSLIPGVTPLSNPFWTISANAERCIERILAEDLV